MSKLGQGDIKLLKAVHQGLKSTDELSKALSLSLPRISIQLTRLKELGFLRISKEGRELRIRPSEQLFSVSLGRLFQEKVQLEKLLPGPGLPLLLTLVMPLMGTSGSPDNDGSLDAPLIQRFSGLSRATIYRGLKEAVRVAAVKQLGKRYRLSQSMTSLREFLESYANYLAQKRLKELAGKSGVEPITLTLLKVCGQEFLFSAEAGTNLPFSPELSVTGVSAMKRDGLPFLASREYYHFTASQRARGPEDTVLGLLLLAERDPRNLSYAGLYLRMRKEKLELDNLRGLGRVFGVQEKMGRLLTAEGVEQELVELYREELE
jgi:DNA-binding IclR family transcriptional regulator